MPVHLSLCLQYFILLFTIATIIAFILLLLLLFHYYHHYKTVATDKPLRASLFPGAAELTTHLLKLINILWLPLYRINKFGFYFPRRLLGSPILVGHQPTNSCKSAQCSCFTLWCVGITKNTSGNLVGVKLDFPEICVRTLFKDGHVTGRRQRQTENSSTTKL
jgi:hypothetical protein